MILDKIDGLTKGSHKIVKVQCDKCGTIKEMKYQTFVRITKDNTEKYYCNNKECINEKRTLSLNKKYGVDNVFQLECVKEQSKETCLEKYGVENPQQNKEIREKSKSTINDIYGCDNVFQNEEIKRKSVETCFKNNGVKYPQQSKLLQDKSKKTNLKNFGVEHPSQDPEIFSARLKKSFQLHKYKDTNLYYQASYEKDFLDKYYGKVKIDNGFSIEYEMDGNKHIYHPDFYLPDFDLVVEIKSTYWFNTHKEKCLIKEKYAKKHHNYILIMDKYYDAFEKYLEFHF